MSTETLKPVTDRPPVEETPLHQPDNKPADKEVDEELAKEIMEDLNSGVFFEKPDVVVSNLMNKVHKRDQIRDPIIVKAAVDRSKAFNLYEVEKRLDEEQKGQDEKNTF